MEKQTQTQTNIPDSLVSGLAYVWTNDYFNKNAVTRKVKAGINKLCKCYIKNRYSAAEPGGFESDIII